MTQLVRLSLLMLVVSWFAGCGGGASSNSGNSGGGGSNPTSMLSTFSGQYAFVLTGFDATGNPMAVAGSITADGKGNISAGSADVNDNYVLSSSISLSGTYTLDSTFRGVITLTNTLGSLPHPLAFAFVLKSSGTSGDLIGLDANPFTIAGTIQEQSASSFSLGSAAGNYVFELDSNAPKESNRQSEIGRFALASNGTTTGGLIDTSIVGSGTTSASFSPVFAGSGPNGTTGRGTLTITRNAQTTNYIYYIVNGQKMFIIESDPSTSATTILAGTAMGQTIPTSANTSGSVFALAGIDATTSPSNNESAVGQLQITNLSAKVTWDSNDVGKIHGGSAGPVTASGQTVTYDATTGRGTITIASGFSGGLFDSAVFYLSGPGQGVLLDTTASTNNRALDGSLQQQTGQGSFSASSLSDAMLMRAAGNSINNTGTVAGIFVPASSTFTLTFDSRSVGITSQNLVSTGDAVSGIDATTGRGTLAIVPVSGVGNSTTEIFYLVAPNQFIFVDATPSPGNAPAPLFFFDPQ